VCSEKKRRQGKEENHRRKFGNAKCQSPFLSSSSYDTFAGIMDGMVDAQFDGIDPALADSLRCKKRRERKK
jgi:hypothetical protein